MGRTQTLNSQGWQLQLQEFQLGKVSIRKSIVRRFASAIRAAQNLIHTKEPLGCFSFFSALVVFDDIFIIGSRNLRQHLNQKH